MTDEQIKYSLETGELKLEKFDMVTHYGIVGFLLFIPLIFLYLHLRDYFFGIPKPLREGGTWFLIVPILFALVFYRIQRNRLKFKSVKTNLTRTELADIIEKVTTELNWKPIVIKEKFFLAKTYPSFFSGSWGEQIIILFDKNKILINSICDPDKKSSVVSMGRNKKNMNTLIKEIINASR